MADDGPTSKRMCADPEDLIPDDVEEGQVAGGAPLTLTVGPPAPLVSASGQPVGSADQQPPRVVHVRNVKAEAREQDLAAAFSIYGTVTQVLVLNNLSQALVEFQVG